MVETMRPSQMAIIDEDELYGLAKCDCRGKENFEWPMIGQMLKDEANSIYTYEDINQEILSQRTPKHEQLNSHCVWSKYYDVVDPAKKKFEVSERSFQLELKGCVAR